MESLLRQILIRLVRNFEEKKGSGAPSGSLITTDKTAVIIEDYFLYEYQNLSLEELAVKLGLGTRQTERLLQKQMCIRDRSRPVSPPTETCSTPSR